MIFFISKIDFGQFNRKNNVLNGSEKHFQNHKLLRILEVNEQIHRNIKELHYG